MTNKTLKRNTQKIVGEAKEGIGKAATVAKKAINNDSISVM